MHSLHSAARAFACLLVCYALVVALFAPLAARKATAAPPPVKATTSPQPPAVQAKKKAARKARELVVRFKSTTPESERQQLLAFKGARRLKKLKGKSRSERIEVPAAADLEALAAELKALPQVELAEPNYLLTKEDLTPDDARFAEQWALSNTGQAGGQAGADINIRPAWERIIGSPATVIAVIDSGIDFTHPELIDNQWTNNREIEGNSLDDDQNGLIDDVHGWDWTRGDHVIRDEQGHGTSIAGIIAARGNNSEGVTGVMWRAALMSLRILDNTGTGDIATAIEAIDYAAENGAQVINASWGTTADSIFLKEAILRAGTRGVVFVCSAGNSARDLDSEAYYPAAYDLLNLISVASTDGADQLATFSNWGAERVSIAAPGVNILTTQMGGGYRMVSGTSASAPLVAGIAGLVKSLSPGIVSSVAAAAIRDGVRVVPQLDNRVRTRGVANAAGALAAMTTANAPVPTPPPGGWTPAPTPPPATPGAPEGLPSLDEVLSTPAPPPGAPAQQVTANLRCLDCDPSGEPGGGYIPPGDTYYGRARLEPKNETGQPGVDLGSRNYNWGVPLVGLPGRAGLDVAIGLYYNSLVWTRDNTGIKFDADRGQPTAGFRIGFPSIQGPYTSKSGAQAYVMITPEGGRIELRYQSTLGDGSKAYYSADNQFTELLLFADQTALVRTADGTQYHFYHVASGTFIGEKRCHQITDRNGNYITITYTASQRPSIVTDTLGRQIVFNYDAQNYLDSITQNRGGATPFVWAKFGYGDLPLAYNFPGLTVSGVPDSGAIGILTHVGLPDGSKYTFDYNTYGQVYRINHYANDGTTLQSRTTYNLPGTTTTAQSDCPRFTTRQEWVRMGVMNADATVTYTYATDNSSYSQVTTPEGTIHKELFHTTADWKRGLTSESQIISGGVTKKRVVTSWTQDDVALTYQKNPRPAEINIYDEAGRRRRTKITYTSPAQFNLPSTVEEYAADAATLLRRTETSYRFEAFFTDRRIIGLPNVKMIKEGNGTLRQKLEYSYDWDGAYLVGQEPAMGHDPGYSVTFVVGRGNLVGVRRYNVAAPNDANQATWLTLIGYNNSGSVVFTMDNEGHRTNFAYTDNFSDGNQSRNARAYPVQVTDADNFSFWTSYNFHTGQVVNTQDAKGMVTSTTYDDLSDRVKEVKNLTSGAYTRYTYHPGYNLSYTKVTATQPAEMLSEVHLDGVGRVRATASTFPGSTGGRRAIYNLWDSNGRLRQTTNPAEISGAWVPAGDDAAGWRWTTHSYDWMGRVTRTDNTDGSYTEMQYNACGCAGGCQQAR